MICCVHFAGSDRSLKKPLSICLSLNSSTWVLRGSNPMLLFNYYLMKISKFFGLCSCIAKSSMLHNDVAVIDGKWKFKYEIIEIISSSQYRTAF